MNSVSRPIAIVLRIAAVLCVVVAISARSIAATPTAADIAIEQFSSDFMIDSFEAVANNIAFEPYAGQQRSPAGTALSRSGNSIDKAMLLAHVIDQQVHAWRIVQGKLDDSGLSQLLLETSPVADDAADISSAGLEIYNPVNDTRIRTIARDHYWLEVQKKPGDDWLALDPTFPHARAGKTYANGSRRHTSVPRRLKQRLTITFMRQTADGRSRRLGRVDGDVADLAQFPVALVIRGIPQFNAAEKTPSAESDNGMVGSSGGGLLGSGGGGGLFGGGSSKKTKPVKKTQNDDRTIVGTEYRGELTFGGEKPVLLKTTIVTDADVATLIEKEWIEFKLHIPGQKTRTLRRDLFVASVDQKQPAAIRRYSIAIIAGELTRVAFDDYRSALDAKQVLTTELSLAKLQQQPKTNETALEIMQLESDGALAPYLIGLAFAYESDLLTARLAAGAGVRIVRDLPRILITSVETRMTGIDEAQTSTTLDLRLDEVTAVPFSGWPFGSTALFQRSRGMQESALEGRVLALFVEDGSTVITTEKVLHAAQTQGHELIMLAPENRTTVAKPDGLPATVAARIDSTLDAGHQVIIPTGAATIDGYDHWGWWDVDPASGAFVGVMESGQHQAMVQYTVTLEKIGVNDGMGFVIGAIVGSTATVTLYAAKMIEYGRVTPQLIAEVAAGIEQLTCVICPSFEVIVSPLAVSASVESSCFGKTGKSIGFGGGASGSIAFCENYKLGISCAASLMLGTYEEKAEVSIGPKVSVDLGPLSCK